jgi:putative endonuclease
VPQVIGFVDSLVQWWRRRGATGPRGERIAAKHLKSQRYRILARNLRNRFGEVDLLAEAPDGRTIVIVEVKSRRLTDADDATTRPEHHVNAAKQRKLVALATQIIRRHRLTDRPVRFDVIGVDIVATGKPIVRHHEAAFGSRY